MEWLFKSILILCLSVIAVNSFCLISHVKKLSDRLLYLSSNISNQTAQQSWLVSHYFKPVRGIFPWDINHCEYCGSNKTELQTEDDLKKRFNGEVND